MTREERRQLFSSIVTAVVERPGQLAPALRRAAQEGRDEGLPAPLAALAQKIRSQAATITDADVANLRAAGYSEDQLFELTVATALGQSAQRLGAARRALGRDG